MNFSPALQSQFWATSPPSPLKSRGSFLWLPEQLFLQGVSHLFPNSFGSQYLGLLTSFPNQTGRFGQPYQLQFLIPILNTRATENQPPEVRQCITDNLGVVYKCTVVLWARDTWRMLCPPCHGWRRLVVMFLSMEPYKRTTESHLINSPASSHRESRNCFNTSCRSWPCWVFKILLLWDANGSRKLGMRHTHPESVFSAITS